jgi:hypothetical protein
MCPVCLTTAALIAASLASTGGLAAIAIQKFSVKNGAESTSAQNPPKEDHHG